MLPLLREGEKTKVAVVGATGHVAEVADLLAGTALGLPRGRAPDVAGPEPMNLVEAAHRTLAARGDATEVQAFSPDGMSGVGMDGTALMPGPEARLGTTTFESWLGRRSRA
jgi:hypothetical protein